MAKDFLKPSTVEQLLKDLQSLEADAGVITLLTRGVNDAQQVGNYLELRGKRPGEENLKDLYILELKGTTPDAQRSEMAAELKKGDAPVEWCTVAVQDPEQPERSQDILLY